MSRVCEECGKKTRVGNQIARRGLAKYKGGVGIKTTGVTRRRFKPNVQRVRALSKNDSVTRMRLCTKCIRTGRIRKPLRREIPEGLRNRMRAKEEAKSPAARKARAAKAGERRRRRKAEARARAAAKQK